MGIELQTSWAIAQPHELLSYPSSRETRCSEIIDNILDLLEGNTVHVDKNIYKYQHKNATQKIQKKKKSFFFQLCEGLIQL